MRLLRLHRRHEHGRDHRRRPGSIGKSVDELIDFYRETGTEMFQRTRYLARLNSLYQNGPLQQKLQEVFGADDRPQARQPEDPAARRHANVTTDSPWPISSNPEARYNLPERERLQSLHSALEARSRQHRGADLLSAGSDSTWIPTDESRSRSCSSTAASRPTTTPRSCSSVSRPIRRTGLKWPTGERNLLLVSVGTGAAATEGAIGRRSRRATCSAPASRIPAR